MPGLFRKLKTYIGRQIFLHTDANEELDNIINHLEPQYIDDQSQTTNEMQEMLSPGGVGTEVKATSLAEEIQQLRYMLDLIIGGVYWYSTPATDLATLSPRRFTYPQYADDAAFLAAKGSAVEEGDRYYNTTYDVVRVYAASGWRNMPHSENDQLILATRLFSR